MKQDTTPDKINDPEQENEAYELKFCPTCIQMKNHLDGVCQKCKTKNPECVEVIQAEENSGLLITELSEEEIKKTLGENLYRQFHEKRTEGTRVVLVTAGSGSVGLTALGIKKIEEHYGKNLLIITNEFVNTNGLLQKPKNDDMFEIKNYRRESDPITSLYDKVDLVESKPYPLNDRAFKGRSQVKNRKQSNKKNKKRRK